MKTPLFLVFIFSLSCLAGAQMLDDATDRSHLSRRSDEVRQKPSANLSGSALSGIKDDTNGISPFAVETAPVFDPIPGTNNEAMNHFDPLPAQSPEATPAPFPPLTNHDEGEAATGNGSHDVISPTNAAKESRETNSEARVKEEKSGAD